MSVTMDIADLPTIDFTKIEDSKNRDLRKLSVVQLRDLIQRQDKLLKNKKLINSLPDKGQKIFQLRERAHENLKNKELVEQATSLVAQLNLKCAIDLKHPMAASPTISKPKIEPYAAVLCNALEERKMFNNKVSMSPSTKKPVAELSLSESLEMSKAQLEKEHLIDLNRRVERAVKFYDGYEDEDAQVYGDDYENDRSTTVFVHSSQ